MAWVAGIGTDQHENRYEGVARAQLPHMLLFSEAKKYFTTQYWCAHSTDNDLKKKMQ